MAKIRDMGGRQRFRRAAGFLLVLVMAIVELPGAAGAQQPGKTDAPSTTPAGPTVAGPSVPSSEPAAVPPTERPPAKAASHPFWDKTNILLFSGVGVFRGMDYASTRNMQARGREEILLPDDVVNNSAGFASLEAAGTAMSVGLSYLMHHTGHHSLERWVSIVHISVTGFGVVRNYALESKHPAAPVK